MNVTSNALLAVSALFVETDGVYFGLPDVDPWDEARDARRYAGHLPVVAHPPCQRWGRFWHGSTRKPHQYKLGDDGGCFASALDAVRKWGGVLEHPCDSHAWRFHGLTPPKRHAGWQAAGDGTGWTCYVEQGHYGHMSRKPTWLYAVGCALPELDWSKGAQRLHPVALERYGYEKARRIGMTAMVGGKDKTRMRNATPEPFRDVLLGMARSVTANAEHDPRRGTSRSAPCSCSQSDSENMGGAGRDARAVESAPRRAKEGSNPSPTTILANTALSS